MQVKTNDGNYDVASKGLGNTALGLGIAGLATSLLGGGASLLGMTRNGGPATANPSDPDALKSQVASLASVTKVFIPSTNVCQTGCGCGCNQ